MIHQKTILLENILWKLIYKIFHLNFYRFKNLLALDPTYILPVLTACLYVAHRRADVLSSRDEKIYEFVSKTNYLSFSKKELEELAPKPDVPKQFYKSIIIPFCCKF